MKKTIIKIFFTVIISFMLAISIHLIKGTEIVAASSGGCDKECSISGECVDNPEGGIKCTGGTKPDGMPFCDNQPCSDIQQN